MSNLKKYILALLIAFVVLIPIANIAIFIILHKTVLFITLAIIYLVIVGLVIKAFNYDKD